MSTFFHRGKLSRKVLIPICALLSMVILCFGILLWNRIMQIEENMAEESARGVSRVFKDCLEFSMSEGVSNFDPVLQKIGQFGKISHPRLIPAPVLETEGKDVPDEWETQVLNTSEAVCGFVDSATGRTYRVSLPVLAQKSCIECHSSAKEGQVLAAVGFRLDTTEWDRSIHNLLKSGALLSLLSFFFILCFIAWITLSVVTRPLGKAVLLAEEVAKGDFTQRLDLNQNDEIGRLASALNDMVAELRRSSEEASRLDGFIKEHLTHSVHDLQALSSSLTEFSMAMASAAEETSSQALVVSSAAEQVDANTSTVAVSCEQMTASIREISNNSTEASSVARNAVGIVQLTNTTIEALGQRSKEIGNVISMINSIAQQTNLLALNATIEAARAGEAGKGFAVVAKEVKDLAKQTAIATEEITESVVAIQTSTTEAVTGIQEITHIMEQVNNIFTTIASAVEEQIATTDEIARNVTESAKGTQEIASNITGVATSATSTSNVATQCLRSAGELNSLAEKLSMLLMQMKSEASA
jgi:methyl-accepting chemotaxis protein